MVDPYNACSSRSTRLFHFTPRHCDWLIVIVCVYANCQLQAYSSRTSLIWWWVIADVEEEEEKNGLSLHTTSIFTSKWLLIYIYILYIEQSLSASYSEITIVLLTNLCIHRDDTFPILFSSKLLVTTLQNTVDKTMPCFNLFFWDMRPHLVILLMKLLKLRAWSRWEKKTRTFF